MKIEIETRFLDINKVKLISKLIELGAEDKGEIMLNDIIFYDQDLKWQNENKIVRLRRKADHVTLTFKENKEQTVDSAKEIEFIVSDMDEARCFLDAVGLRMYRTVERYRHTFVLDGVSIDIDTWPKIPTYVELEGGSVEILKLMAKKLDLVWENKFDGDPKFVYKKYGIDLDKITIISFDKFE